MMDAPQRSTEAVEIVRLSQAHAPAVVTFLQAIEAEGEAKWFQPHPFTLEHIEALCQPGQRDLYYIMTFGSAVVGYGLLRGWDEGYPVPSLGIAVHSAYRGKGLGAALMAFLHCAARLRGSDRVRLRVYDSNDAAIALYRRLGYRFDSGREEGAFGKLVVAFKELNG